MFPEIFFRIINNYKYYSTLITVNGFWWSIATDFVVPLLIAGGVAYMAFRIFVLESRRDQKRIISKENQIRHDKLLYFSTLVHNVLQNSEQQTEHLNDLVNALKSDPIPFHLMTIVPLNDHKRIVEIINLEVYLLSYASHFNSERNISILEFQKIISSVDYLYSTFLNLRDFHLNAQNFDTDRKLRFSGLFDSAYAKLQIVYIIFQREDNSYSKQFFQWFENFATKSEGKNTDISYYYSQFFDPLHSLLSQYIINNQPLRMEILDLISICKNAILIYDGMKLASADLISDYEDDIININSSIKGLKRDSKPLLDKFLDK